MSGAFRKIFFVVFLSAVSVAVLPRHAHATVPAWDEGAWGMIPPIITPTIPAPPGSDYSLKISINSLSYGAILSKIIPSWNQVSKTLARFALQMVKDQTIRWIRSGFEGEPLFLQDPEKFFTEMADQASGVFIEDLGVRAAGDPNFFCKDFLPQVQLDIAGYGQRGYFDRARCTVTDVVANVEDYYNDFSNGEWDALYRIRERNNNRYGFYMMTLEEQDRRREEAENFFKLSAQYGGGYLPKGRCIEANALGCRKFQIVTPSKAIGDRVGAMVGIDFQDLIAADELAEVVSAVVQELINYGIRESLDSFL